jgi:hypothetical protein
VPGIYGMPAHSVLDVLRVPADLPAGPYVLGWRYDCEGTAQARLPATRPPMRARMPRIA